MEIIKGEDKIINVRLSRKICNDLKEPADLTGKTVTVQFKAGTLQNLTGTIVNAVLGKISFEVDKLLTEQLCGPSFDFDVSVTDGAGEVEKWKFRNQVVITDRIK